MSDMLWSALLGAGSGFVFGLSGWFKNGGEFDVKKMAPTLVLSLVGGALIGATGVKVEDANLQTAVTGLSSAGFAIVVQNVVNGLFSKKKKK